LQENGSIKLENGESHASPSKAATEAVGGGSFDGWEYWKVERLKGELLKDVRRRFIEQTASSDD